MSTKARAALAAALYVGFVVVDQRFAVIGGPLLGAFVNRWWFAFAGIAWLLAPMLPEPAPTEDSAGDWNPWPIVIVFVVPIACATIAAGVAARRVISRLRR